MKFVIDRAIFGKFPGVNIGLVVAKGIDNTGESGEIANMIREREREIRANFQTETLSQDPKIEAWRKAYSSFGAKPKKYKCSVENIYRMILGGLEVRHISKIVDIYNYLSIKHVIPAGGDDIDKVEGNIVLRFARGDENFTELNSSETKNPGEGEVVYADDREVLCRRWNWRECDKSKMTEETKNVAIVVEGLPPFGKENIEGIAKELAEMVRKFCGGEVSDFVLDADNPEMEI
jgi:lysyl-tRNA synthetase class 2